MCDGGAERLARRDDDLPGLRIPRIGERQDVGRGAGETGRTAARRAASARPAANCSSGGPEANPPPSAGISPALLANVPVSPRAPAYGV